MHVQDGPDLDLSVQVARVKEKTRPWWSIISLVLAIAAAITSAWAHSSFDTYFRSDHVPYQIVAAASAVAFCVFASIATYGLSRNARSVLEPRIGTAHAAVVKYFLLLIGGFATLAITLALFHVPVSQLLLGGVLTSVIVGIAAQQAMSNVFAGMVLLLARPFRAGDADRAAGRGDRRGADRHGHRDRHHLRAARHRRQSRVRAQLAGAERRGGTAAAAGGVAGPF